MVVRHELLRFGVVGAVGFAVDGGILSGLMLLGMGHYLARAFSFPVAVTVTWWLNRTWTFADSNKAEPGRQFKRYFALQVVGALSNFAVYLAVLTQIEPTWQNALLALAIGAVVGLAINFVGSKLLIYRVAGEVGE